MNVGEELPDVYLFGCREDYFMLPLSEICELLDGYSVDEIQVLIGAHSFTERTYRALRPYLTDRLKNEEQNFF